MKFRIIIATLAVTLTTAVPALAQSSGAQAYEHPETQTTSINTTATQPPAEGGTLPVTGFDALLFFGAAAIAGGAGFILRKS